jgi:polyisoprenyl-teichoic acid--peptidoglycan teichoic acid transferase
VTSVQFVPPLITPSHPDFGKVRQLVASAISKSEKPAKAKGTSGAGASASATSPSSTGSSASPNGEEPVDAKAVCKAVS